MASLGFTVGTVVYWCSHVFCSYNFPFFFFLTSRASKGATLTEVLFIFHFLHGKFCSSPNKFELERLCNVFIVSFILAINWISGVHEYLFRSSSKLQYFIFDAFKTLPIKICDMYLWWYFHILIKHHVQCIQFLHCSRIVICCNKVLQNVLFSYIFFSNSTHEFSVFYPFKARRGTPLGRVGSKKSILRYRHIPINKSPQNTLRTPQNMKSASK